jgi:hypothetical protein
LAGGMSEFIHPKCGKELKMKIMQKNGTIQIILCFKKNFTDVEIYFESLIYNISQMSTSDSGIQLSFFTSLISSY